MMLFSDPKLLQYGESGFYETCSTVPEGVESGSGFHEEHWRWAVETGQEGSNVVMGFFKCEITFGYPILFQWCCDVFAKIFILLTRYVSIMD